ncbi:MAG: hypothetical protein ACXV7F_04405, partial [Methylomonas sp.]
HAHIEDGRAKIFVIWKTLAYRKARPELFYKGDYLPLEAAGYKAEHICAYRWQHEGQILIVIVGRWFAQLETDQDAQAFLWRNTRIAVPDTLEAMVFRNLFSGTTIRVHAVDSGRYLIVDEILKHFPVALLVSDAGKAA